LSSHSVDKELKIDELSKDKKIEFITN